MSIFSVYQTKPIIRLFALLNIFFVAESALDCSICNPMFGMKPGNDPAGRIIGGALGLWRSFSVRFSVQDVKLFNYNYN